MGNTEANQRFVELEVDRSKGEVHEDWNVSPGKLRETPVTVFSAIHPPSSRKRPFMEKALQASKVYRHPALLRYHDGGTLDNEIIIVMEQASPLLVHGLENMSFLQITAGLASIIEALVFLHDKAGVSHNNVSVSSIYVTSEGIWKLWGFEYLCSFGDLTRDHIERINQYCNEKSLPPDDKSRITPAYQHTRDCYFFGRLIQDLVAPFLDVDQPMVVEFLRFIRERSLHREWVERPRLSAFLEHSLFKHEFLKLRHDIANILLLQVDQRDQFIRSLPSALKNYPDRAVASTLSSLLLSRTFLLIPSSVSHLMPCLLTPKSSKNDAGLFSVPVFKEIIIPLILRLFMIHDATVRKILLAHFQHYVHLFEKEQLTLHILPQVLLGIRDTDEDLVGSTLRCLADLIPLLGADVVVGKNREQIFTTTKPKIKPKGILRNSEVMKKLKKPIQPPTTLVINKGGTDLPQQPGNLNLSNVAQAPLSSESDNISLDIPERSSPDGGETIDEDPFVQKETKIETKDCSVEGPSDDQWSDWEEMLDPPMPDFVGVLEVKTPEPETVGRLNDIEEETMRSTKPNNSATLPRSLSAQPMKASVKQSTSRDSDTSLPFVKGSAMRLKDKSMTTSKTSKTQGLGEEYDIMSIKVEKKHDSELDLFADLAPSLPTKDYNLETMLMEASHKTRRKLPSLSDTLAELDVGTVEEGEDWNEDGNCIPSEDLPSVNCQEEPNILSVDSSEVFHAKPSVAQVECIIADTSVKESTRGIDEWDQDKWDTF